MRGTGEFTSVYSFFALDDTGFGPRQPYQASVGRVRRPKSMLTEDKANRVRERSFHAMHRKYNIRITR
jgi:hypothetical protein